MTAMAAPADMIKNIFTSKKWGRRTMIDLAVGTRFYYRGRLCEVIEVGSKSRYCEGCVIRRDTCIELECDPEARHDGKEVCFKWVED